MDQGLLKKKNRSLFALLIRDDRMFVLWVFGEKSQGIRAGVMLLLHNTDESALVKYWGNNGILEWWVKNSGNRRGEPAPTKRGKIRYGIFMKWQDCGIVWKIGEITLTYGKKPYNCRNAQIEAWPIKRI